MKKIYFVLIAFSLAACNKKITPAKSEAKPNTTVIAKKPNPKIVTPVPKVISVADAAAKKSVDGRLYYDLEGKRYWKNYKDGKFYLYNKSMHGNPDFTPPK